MMKFTGIFLIVINLLLVAGCQTVSRDINSSTDSEITTDREKIVLQDASGTEVTLDKSPEKIICLHLSCVDILAELDLRPAGITEGLYDLSSSPVYFGEEAKDIAPISGRGEPNIEQLLLIKPDLIIGHAAQYTSQQETLEKIAPLYVTEVYTITDAIDNLKAVAKLMGKTEQAEVSIQNFQNKLADYQNRSPKNLTVLLTNGTEGNFYVATDQSLVGSILAQVANYPWRLSGQIPSALNWVMLSQEEILTLDPDVIFILTPSANPNRLEQLQQDAFWKELKAVKNEQVYELEDVNVGGLTTGTRALTAFLDEIMPKLYPDVFGELSQQSN
ncbi:ABC transporter substrate-binding protein [Synechococcus sp. BDU 130192]|uniref:ABC transporter substrate-binding protein n=1 Tax=Synechococcus sp. BDU 130192 TaxID=2042059 RepID=UPI001C1F60B2|nr:ABC transporter substrate-binding protein [Synechococcus sp. BDU 130192]